MTMQILTYQVSFNTPAFLGNAEQQAQWRTPPFKALIRQWWRVVKAPQVGYDHKKLLTLENELFGAAFDGGEAKSHRSLIQLRLSAWGEGTLNSVPKGETIDHPEVPKAIGANLYLGYGPIGGVVPRSAISPDAPALVLRLRLPSEHEDDIRKTLQLAHWFGSVGSRCRNGFGSIHIEGDGILPAKDLKFETLNSHGVLRSNDACLHRDWPHAIGLGVTNAPTVWRLLKLENKQLDGFASWQEVMHKLAQIKVTVRTAEFFEFKGGGKDGHPRPQPRHLLSYPSGSNHAVSPWGKDARLANQVRLKVHRRLDGKYMALIVHVPCALPDTLAKAIHQSIPNQMQVWAEVHRLLDAQRSGGLIRLPGAN